MRLSPDGRRLAFIAGKGLRPAQPMVTLDLEGVILPLEPGHSPRWASNDQAVYGPQDDGPLRVAPADRVWVPRAGALPSGNSVTAAAGRIAVHRTDPRRILSTFRAPILGAMFPVLSDDGEWLVYQLPDQPREKVSTLLVERADGEGEPRILWTGAPNNVRAAGRSFVWEIGGGQIAGIADAGNPNAQVETFPLPAWRIFEPVPVWHGSRGELGVMFLADDGRSGHIRYADWGSLRAGKPAGFVLGTSTGSGYEHDARPLGAAVRTVWFDAAGMVVDGRIDLNAPRAALTPPPAVIGGPKPEPPPPPPVLPDIPWKTDPNGVIEDIADWLFSTNQGPDIHISPDGNVRFFCKSDEVSGDGPDPHIGEHWVKSDDPTDFNIGHHDDASTGRRVLNGKAVTPEDLRKTGDFERLWPGLKLSHNWFKDGARLWMPRRLVSGTRFNYVTDILWNSTTPETPNSTVWKNIPVEIRVDVGYGRYRGRDVFARVAYVPDGKPEVNYYTKPEGFNAWVIAAGNSDPWAGHPA